MGRTLAGVDLVASLSGMLSVEGNAVFILECAAEYIQGTADGQMYSSVSSLVYGFQIGEPLGSTGISAGNGGPSGEFLDQIQIDTCLFAFYFNRMHEEFRTVGGKVIQGFVGDVEFSEFLPTIRNNPVFSIALTAGKVQHKAFSANGFNQFIQSFFIQYPITENP